MPTNRNGLVFSLFGKEATATGATAILAPNRYPVLTLEENDAQKEKYRKKNQPPHEQ